MVLEPYFYMNNFRVMITSDILGDNLSPGEWILIELYILNKKSNRII